MSINFNWNNANSHPAAASLLVLAGAVVLHASQVAEWAMRGGLMGAGISIMSAGGLWLFVLFLRWLTD